MRYYITEDKVLLMEHIIYIALTLCCSSVKIISNSHLTRSLHLSTCFHSEENYLSNRSISSVMHLNHKAVRHNYFLCICLCPVQHTTIWLNSCRSEHVCVYQGTRSVLVWGILLEPILRADSRFAPNQWEMALQNNDVSHWLGANLESTWTLKSMIGPCQMR